MSARVLKFPAPRALAPIRVDHRCEPSSAWALIWLLIPAWWLAVAWWCFL